eukprot:TRINITY_DN2868_c0_g1_i4.p1 TRINITY_DN2868_c0_g1~~TRINITY_DN2868_c0_g1_i4.p1  ORF type:complete len:357 (-),score=87.35 TRINITY_DN2868_c0_g1_i4:360-1430(-)
MMSGFLGKNTVLRALEPFYINDADADEEFLSFETGDLIRFVEKDDSGWAYGEKDGLIAWFPFDRVEVVDQPENTAAANFLKDQEDAKTSIVDDKDKSAALLNKFILQRPEKKDLAERNILPASSQSKFQKVQKKLEVKKKKDFLGKFLSRRKPALHVGPVGPRTIYGMPLKDVCVDGGIPYVLVDCMAWVKANALDEEGIFRQSGEHKLVELVKSKYTTPKARPDLSALNVSPHAICVAMKMFLNDLPEPLFPFSLYECIVCSFKQLKGSPDEQKSVLKTTLLALPPLNRIVLRALLAFLKVVCAHEKKNKMNAGNLGIVFAPNVLRPEVLTMASASDLTNCEVMAFLIGGGIELD